MSPLKPNIPLLLALALLWVGTVAGGCADAAEGVGPETEDDERPPKIAEALSALANHQVGTANRKYRESLEAHPDYGVAAAGSAVTDLLLLPGSDPIDTLARKHLGADGDLSAQRLLYDTNGLLYWLSRGASWEGRAGEGDGIKTEISDDLPWPDERLESLEAWFNPLTEPIGAARTELVALAERLESIEGNLQTALEDDDFDRIVIPGRVFYHEQGLTLELGKSELATLAALTSAMRGFILSLSAYQYDWSLSSAFATPCEAIDEDPRSHWEPYDCTIYFLGSKWFRTIERPSHLESAQQAFAASLEHVDTGLRCGLLQRCLMNGGAGCEEFRSDGSVDCANTPEDELRPSTLQWRKLDESDVAFVEELRTFLEDLREAVVSGSFVELHGTRLEGGAAVSANFEPLFVPGRTLPDETHWLIERATETTPDGQLDFYWDLNADATDHFFVEGLFEPQPDPPERSLVVEFDAESNSGSVTEKLLSEFGNAIEDAYLDSR